MISFSHAAATDMPFSAMFTIAMVAAAILLRLVPPERSPISAPKQSSPQPPASSLTSFTSSNYFAAALFGFFLGLAVLAKAPLE